MRSPAVPRQTNANLPPRVHPPEFDAENRNLQSPCIRPPFQPDTDLERRFPKKLTAKPLRKKLLGYIASAEDRIKKFPEKNTAATRIIRIRNNFYISQNREDEIASFGKASCTRAQCIYAICHPSTSKIYVGETTKTALERLITHFEKARVQARATISSIPKALLYSHMCKTGWKKWVIIVLEWIPGSFNHVDSCSNKCRKHKCCRKQWSKKLADHSDPLAREKFWSNRLGSWAKRVSSKGRTGLNNQHASGAKYRHFGASRSAIRKNPAPLVSLTKRLSSKGKTLHWRKKCSRIFGSRDWLRHFVHLVIECHYRKLHPLYFRNHGYRTAKIIRIYEFSVNTSIPDILNHCPHYCTEEYIHEVKSLLRKEISFRFPKLRDQNPNKTALHNLIILGFTEASFDHKLFQKACRLPSVRDAIDPIHTTGKHPTIPPPTVVFKFGSTVGSVACNTNTFDALEFSGVEAIANGACKCHLDRYKKFIHPELGHVATCDTSFFGFHSLQQIMSRGTKHRLDFCQAFDDNGEPVGPYMAIHFAVKSYIERLTEHYKLHNDGDSPGLSHNGKSYIEVLRNALHKAYNSASCNNVDESKTRDYPSHFQEEFLTKPMLRHLKRIQKDFVIGITDKSPQDYSICCKKWTAQCMLRELLRNDSPYIRVTDETEKDITKRHRLHFKNNFQKLRLRPMTPKLPTFKGILKFHKSPPILRFIAASADCSTKWLSVRLNEICNLLAPRVEDLWISTLAKAGIKSNGSWILKNSTEVAKHIALLNQETPLSQRQHLRFQAHDFSTLYTGIELNVLADRFDDLLDRLFAKPRSNNGETFTHFRIRLDTRGSIGTPCNAPSQQRTDKRKMYCPLSTIKAAFRYLFFNTYVKLGDAIFKQRIGIPMGTNCAVHIANFFLFTYELDFIERCIAHNELNLLKEFLWCKRYIDDVLGINCPRLSQFATLENIQLHGVNFGIYPSFLKLNVEQPPSRKIHFLDLWIYYNKHNRTFETTLYSKRDDPKFSKLAFYRYPHITSKLSTECKYNVVTSQVIRFSRICSRADQFIYHTAYLLAFLYKNRLYSKKRLFSITRRSLPLILPRWKFHNPKTAFKAIERRFQRLLFENSILN